MNARHPSAVIATLFYLAGHQCPQPGFDEHDAESAAALTAHIDGEASIADLNKALGVKPPEVWDLYVCDKQGVAPLGPSIIARCSDEGSHYKSAPAWHAGNDPELRVGFDLAKAAGLIRFCGVTGDEDDDD